MLSDSKGYRLVEMIAAIVPGFRKFWKTV